jgi:hypothetical protein
MMSNAIDLCLSASINSFSSTRMRDVRIASLTMSLTPIFFNLWSQRHGWRFQAQHF